MQTILIEIAAYRDDELPKTIASCLANAAYAERLRFAIVHQYGPETQGQIDVYHHDDRFTIIERDWREARGVGVARADCDALYVGEDFYLQIDSHMRFEPNWDERLIAQWRQCGDKNAILSSYPPAFNYADDGSELFAGSDPNRLIIHDMFMDRIPTFFGKTIPGNPQAPQLCAFAAGGLQFGPGRRCLEVPYNRDICFIGEEIVHSLRLFAAGYNIYSPIDQPIYHLYIRSKNQRNAYHFWKDFLDDEHLNPIYHEMNRVSYDKVDDYFAGKVGVSEEVVRKFENFAGFDYFSKKVHPSTELAPELPMSDDDGWRQAAIPPKKHD
ncbi:hypothetical protein GX865_00780 [Candidatus Saccharibacteria bacterium]|jgi:hypothetical protein|nr:hypothetical protein [Candidatus Saccharibacteria bacterium]